MQKPRGLLPLLLLFVLHLRPPRRCRPASACRTSAQSILGPLLSQLPQQQQQQQQQEQEQEQQQHNRGRSGRRRRSLSKYGDGGDGCGGLSLVGGGGVFTSCMAIVVCRGGGAMYTVADCPSTKMPFRAEIKKASSPFRAIDWTGGGLSCCTFLRSRGRLF